MGEVAELGEKLHDENQLTDQRISIDLIQRIDADPANAIRYLTEYNDKFAKSNVHLLLVLLENGRYESCEDEFLSLPMNHNSPNRIHKHIDDITNKINAQVKILNTNLSKEDPRYIENITKGFEWKKKLWCKYFPEQAKIIYEDKDLLQKILAKETISE